MNPSFEIFHEFALLFSQGIHLSDVLISMGFSRIYLYGVGEIGKIILSDLTESGMVISAFDKSVDSHNEIKLNDIPVYSIEEIPQDDITILISPASLFEEIADTLRDVYGVKRKRILSVRVLLKYADYYLKKKREPTPCKACPEFLITGANFDNKGSQAMTFVTMDQLRRRYSNPIIWFCANFNDEIYDLADYLMIDLRDGFGADALVREVISRVDAVIDVSGYAVSSTPGFGATERILDYLKMAYGWKVPYYMMPQSFGPIDYPAYKLAEMKELLSFCRVIYAREKESEKVLMDLGLQNVYRSYDMVLQAEEPLECNIYSKPLTRDIITYCGNSVAVVPNTNLFIFRDEVVEIYVYVIERLIALGKHVYLIPHSGDKQLCDAIMQAVSQKGIDVQYVDNLYDCLAFSNFIEGFDYVVSSRYHAVVHSYKNNIPCVIIGWADKYGEIAEIFGQTDFLVDVRSEVDLNHIGVVLNKIESSFHQNSKKIEITMREVKKTNCFSRIFEDLSLE